MEASETKWRSRRGGNYYSNESPSYRGASAPSGVDADRCSRMIFYIK